MVHGSFPGVSRSGYPVHDPGEPMNIKRSTILSACIACMVVAALIIPVIAAEDRKSPSDRTARDSADQHSRESDNQHSRDAPGADRARPPDPAKAPQAPSGPEPMPPPTTAAPAVTTPVPPPAPTSPTAV